MKNARLCIIFAVCAALLLFPQSVQAATFPVSAGQIQVVADNGEINTNDGLVGTARPVGTVIVQRTEKFVANYLFYVTGNAGDVVTVSLRCIRGQWTNLANTIFINGESTGRLSFTKSGLDFDISFELIRDCDYVPVNIGLYSTVVSHNQSQGLELARVGWDVDVISKSETNSLLDSVIEWLQSIGDDLQGLPDKISNFFSNLSSAISDQFTLLKNNIKGWFDDVGEWFSALGDRISDFFTNLGESISGFFEKLWNRIYWGNEAGESEYQPPVFSSSLDDVLDKIDEYIQQLDDTNQDIENAKNESISYVEQGTTVINTIFGVFPSVLIALIVFGVVFVFCRKVVGR